MKDSPARHRDATRTRERILTVARRLFSDNGYDATTIRVVAAEAGVAPNLVTRYFGGKAGLYREASDIELNVPDALPGPFDELGARIAETVVRRWQAASVDDPLLMMVRAAGSSPDAAAAAGEFFAAQAARPLAHHLARELQLELPEAADRAAAVSSFICGVIMQRYVLRTGPVAVARSGPLRAWLGANIQRLLSEPGPPPLGSLGTWKRVLAERQRAAGRQPVG